MAADDFVDRERLDALPDEVRDTLDYLALQVGEGTRIRVRVTVMGFVLWDTVDHEPPVAALIDPDGNLRDLPWALEEGLPDKSPVVLHYPEVMAWLAVERARIARNN